MQLEQNLTLEQPKSQLTKRIILRAAKLPSVYFILGSFLVALSYIDDIFPLIKWKHLFDYTDKIGNIFFAFALLTFIYKLTVLLLRRLEKKLIEHHRVASLIITSIRKGLKIIFLLATINVIITLIGPPQLYLSVANNLINTIIIGSFGWIAIQVLYTAEAMVYEHMMLLTKKEHKRAKALYTKTRILRNAATVAIVILTIAAILMSFHSVRTIGISLLASAGFLTAIVGLAGQKALFSLFSGIQLALSQQIKIGDVVVIEKESGIIEEITLTYVTMKLGDRRRMVVPIHYFIDKHFENWSHDPDSLRSSLLFNVDYMMPLQPLRDHLTAILKQSSHWDGEANKLQVSRLGEHSVELRIQISAENPDDLSDLRAEVREKMLEFIRDNYPAYFPSSRVSKELETTQHEIETS